MTTYAAFREAHPDGVVLQPESEGSAAASGYDPSGYEAYEEREAFGLRGMRGEGLEREWNREDLDPKTIVPGVTPTDGGALGFPLPAVEAAGGVVEATVGETDVVLLATASTSSSDRTSNSGSRTRPFAPTAPSGFLRRGKATTDDGCSEFRRDGPTPSRGRTTTAPTRSTRPPVAGNESTTGLQTRGVDLSADEDETADQQHDGDR